MSIRRVWAIAKKNLQALRHDRRTIGFLVVMPLLMIVVFGYTFGGEVRNIPVVVANSDQEVDGFSLASAVVSDMVSKGTVSVSHLYHGDSDIAAEQALAVQSVKDTDAWAALVFQSDFTKRTLAAVSALKAGAAVVPATFAIHLDATNPNIVRVIEAELMRSIQSILAAKYGVVFPLLPKATTVYGADAKFIDFFAPGVMGFAALIITFMLSIVAFIHERMTGTLERLLTTPARASEIVLGYAAAYGLVALVQSTIILFTAIFLFQVHVQGNAAVALLVIFLLAIGSQGLGFLLSSIARSEFQAVQFIPLMLIPSILLAGVFWPIEAVPDFLRPLSYIVPLTYAVDGCRSVMLRGWGIEQIWLQITVLLGFAALTLGLAMLKLRQRH